jgi:hypothetical protein
LNFASKLFKIKKKKINKLIQEQEKEKKRLLVSLAKILYMYMRMFIQSYCSYNFFNSFQACEFIYTHTLLLIFKLETSVI